VYDTIGQHYTANRQADPRWEDLIAAELGDARRVVNVGAGTGSYEPMDGRVRVVAIEPSAVMAAQRRADAAPVVRASGAALPLAGDWADVAMAILTIHHWGDWASGLAELRRVARRRLILTIDFEVHARFWLLQDYLPDVADYVRRQAPTLADIGAAMPIVATRSLPLPHDLADGVLGAHWRRPEAYLDPGVRANCSPLALADPSTMAAGIGRLEADLASGAWSARYGHLMEQTSYDLGYRLVVSGDGDSGRGRGSTIRR
jgi:SAM-dependent methyltransferase